MTLLNRSPALSFVLVCVLLDVIGIGLIIPVLPLLVGEFTVNAQAQTLWYGVLIAAYGLAQFFAAPLLGALSDRYGRRPVLLLSQLGWGLDFLLLAFAPSLWWMLLARVLGGVTGAGFIVASAYVADVTTPEKRTQGMGMIGAMFGVGFIVGPALGGILGEWGVRVPFYVAAGVAIVNVVYGYFILPESLPADKRTAYGRQALLAKSNPFTAIWVLRKLPKAGAGVAVLALIVALAITDLVQFMMHTTFVLFTTQRYGWGPFDNGMALLVVGVLMALVQGVLLGPMIKRFGERKLALIALTIGAVEFVGMALAFNGMAMMVVILVFFVAGAAHPAVMGLVSQNVPESEQGAVMGAVAGLSALMIVIAPLIASPLLAATNHYPVQDVRFGTVYLLAAALQAVSAWLVWRALRPNKSSVEGFTA